MLKYAVYWFVFQVLGRLPAPVLYRIAAVVAAVSYVLAARARRNVWDNLRHVMPPGTPKREMRRQARRIFGNAAMYYADIAQLPHMDVDRFFRERLVIRGVEEHLRPCLAEGCGVVMLTGHYGNPELAMQGLVPLGIKITALTEPVQPPALSRMMDRHRRSKGLEFLPVSVGSVKRVWQVLKQGGVVALTGDRDIHGPKQMLPFCGVRTLMPTGPIEIALRTGAVVIPAFSARREGNKIEAIVEEPLDIPRTDDFEADVRAGELAFLQRFERRLREEPGQWSVLEAIWDVSDAPTAVEDKSTAEVWK